VRTRGSPAMIRRGNRGSGSILGVAVMAAVALLGASALAVSEALAEADRVQRVANQAALAASDVARGLAPGISCRVASAIATQAGVRIARCEVDGAIAVVEVAGSWWGMSLAKRAAAAPADHSVFAQ
jgi:secretion/DNA translocation related TadE-like protein